MTDAPAVTPLWEAGDLSAPPGSRPWALAVRLELQALLHDAESNADRLQRNLRGMREHEGHRQLEDPQGQPFPTFERFCVCAPPFGLGYDVGALDQIVAERKSAQVKAQAPGVVGGHGGRRRTKQGSARTLVKRGDNVEYTAAVLARDHPEHLQKLQTGEYKTAAEARRAAGIARKYPKVTPTPKGFERAIRRHLSPEQIGELVALLGEAR